MLFDSFGKVQKAGRPSLVGLVFCTNESSFENSLALYLSVCSLCSDLQFSVVAMNMHGR